MKDKELINVYIDTYNGKTICICQQENKGCPKRCSKDVVERDKFKGWQSAVFRNKYGK